MLKEISVSEMVAGQKIIWIERFWDAKKGNSWYAREGVVNKSVKKVEGAVNKMLSSRVCGWYVCEEGSLEEAQKLCAERTKAAVEAKKEAKQAYIDKKNEEWEASAPEREAREAMYREASAGRQAIKDRFWSSYKNWKSDKNDLNFKEMREAGISMLNAGLAGDYAEFVEAICGLEGDAGNYFYSDKK